MVLGTARLMGAETAFLACFTGLEGTAFFSCLVPVFCAVFAAPCSRQTLQQSSSFSGCTNCVPLQMSRVSLNSSAVCAEVPVGGAAYHGRHLNSVAVSPAVARAAKTGVQLKLISKALGTRREALEQRAGAHAVATAQRGGLAAEGGLAGVQSSHPAGHAAACRILK